MAEFLDSLWNEKYRPIKLDELVLPEKYKKDFQRIIDKCDLPNLLFYGPPGSGKTTLARMLCSKYGVLFNRKDNLLLANGSAKKTRGIGFIDEVVEPFLKTPPSRDKFKVVYIDEADKLTNDGYDSLRAIIEKYQVAYGRFIFTCNYVSRIPDPIQSRFISYQFNQIPKDFILTFCQNILDNEKVTYKETDIMLVINNLYPDVRKIVNTIQRHSYNGVLEVTEEGIITIEKKVISHILQIVSLIEKDQNTKIGQSINNIIEIISQQEIEYRNVYTDLFYDNKMPANVKVIINKYTNTHQNALVPHMHFMGMVFEIVKVLMDYKRAITGK